MLACKRRLPPRAVCSLLCGASRAASLYVFDYTQRRGTSIFLIFGDFRRTSPSRNIFSEPFFAKFGCTFLSHSTCTPPVPLAGADADIEQEVTRVAERHLESREKARYDLLSLSMCGDVRVFSFSRQRQHGGPRPHFHNLSADHACAHDTPRCTRNRFRLL